MWRYSFDQRTCGDCGRPLESCEVCNCRQPVSGMPRDGLRARCPEFRYRSSYRGRAYIGCGNAKLRFNGANERNEHYRLYCCGDCDQCPRRKEALTPETSGGESE